MLATVFNRGNMRDIIIVVAMILCIAPVVVGKHGFKLFKLKLTFYKIDKDFLVIYCLKKQLKSFSLNIFFQF